MCRELCAHSLRSQGMCFQSLGVSTRAHRIWQQLAHAPEASSMVLSERGLRGLGGAAAASGAADDMISRGQDRCRLLLRGCAEPLWRWLVLLRGRAVCGERARKWELTAPLVVSASELGGCGQSELAQ